MKTSYSMFMRRPKSVDPAQPDEPQLDEEKAEKLLSRPFYFWLCPNLYSNNIISCHLLFATLKLFLAVVVVSMTAMSLLERKDLTTSVQQTTVTVEFARSTFDLVHEAQAERGLSVLFLENALNMVAALDPNVTQAMNISTLLSICASTKQFANVPTAWNNLVVQRQKLDRAYNNWLGRWNDIVDHYPELLIKSNCSRFWESQQQMRKFADNVDLPSWYAGVWISTNIEWLIGGVAYLTKAGPSDLGINRIMSTFMLLTWVKEMNGRQRYSLNAVFFRANFKPLPYPSTSPDSLWMKFNARYGPEPSTYSNLFLLVTSERVYNDLFKQTASDSIIDYYNLCLAQKNAQIAWTMKMYAFSNPDSPNLGINPLDWSSNQTVRMNQLKLVSDDISSRMSNELSDRYGIYIRDMIQFVLTIMGALGVAVTAVFGFGAAVWIWHIVRTQTGTYVIPKSARSRHATHSDDALPLHSEVHELPSPSGSSPERSPHRTPSQIQISVPLNSPAIPTRHVPPQPILAFDVVADSQDILRPPSPFNMSTSRSSDREEGQPGIPERADSRRKLNGPARYTNHVS
eukprot:TRINITY_DN7984_c0_g2_i1.p1 TRINITY_DN7984_c0_g2~~TRINITY_DN7984_c0_g2_i1.p1  ORF type:complete len:572 (+),score=28.35 TRINITY_DN7984_c0_g2_i1:220-1935(+)